MEVICDYCRRDVERTTKIYDPDGSFEHVCRECFNDTRYCAEGGRIPQDPEDA